MLQNKIHVYRELLVASVVMVCHQVVSTVFGCVHITSCTMMCTQPGKYGPKLITPVKSKTNYKISCFFESFGFLSDLHLLHTTIGQDKFPSSRSVLPLQLNDT